MVPRLGLALATGLLATGLLGSPAHAQMRVSFGQGRGAGPGRGVGAGPRGGRGIPPRPGRGLGRGRRGRRFGGAVVLPPYYYYPYYPYEGYEETNPAPAPQPPQQPVAKPAPPPAPPAPPVESLLLEDHDGQWVRVPTGNEMKNGPLVMQPESSAGTSAGPAATSGNESAQNQTPSPHAVLVFRDGHQETIDQYVIHGSFIDVSANYWSTGSWTKRIPISELDVPATLKANQERGVKFSLPSGPDEVVVGF